MLVVVAALAATAIASSRTTADQKFYVVGKPITLSLPAGWVPTVTGSATGAFLAYSPNRIAYAAIGDGFPPLRDFGSLARYAIESQTQFYGSRYPDASFRHRRRDLAIGASEEVIVTVPATSERASGEIDSYWFEVRGKTYDLSCTFPTSMVGTYVSICQAAARSLRIR